MVMERGKTEDIVKFTEDRLLLGLGANEKKLTHIWDVFLVLKHALRPDSHTIWEWVRVWKLLTHSEHSIQEPRSEPRSLWSGSGSAMSS